MTTTPDPEELISRARTLSGQYEEAKERYSRLSDERIECIKELRENEVSWAQIGRIFGITPQAAMYVTGHVKRTPAKKTGGKKAGAKKKS